jgi:FkbM family methyltransferase
MLETKEVLTAQGFNLLGYEGDYIPAAIEEKGFWECGLTMFMSHYLKDGDVVLDLGANLGYNSVLASHLVGNSGHVYSFEPVDKTYRLLVRNIKENELDNVTPYKYAAFNEHSISYVHQDAGSLTQPFVHHYNFGGISLESGTIINDQSESRLKLKSVVLDEIFPNKNTHFDLIKMDIEGAEACAFAGMQRIFADNSAVTVVLEYTPYTNLPCNMDKMMHYFKTNKYDPYIPQCTGLIETPEIKISKMGEAKLYMEPVKWAEIDKTESQIESIVFMKNSVGILESTINKHVVGEFRKIALDNIFHRDDSMADDLSSYDYDFSYDL